MENLENKVDDILNGTFQPDANKDPRANSGDDGKRKPVKSAARNVGASPNGGSVSHKDRVVTMTRKADGMEMKCRVDTAANLLAMYPSSFKVSPADVAAVKPRLKLIMESGKAQSLIQGRLQHDEYAGLQKPVSRTAEDIVDEILG